MEKEEKNSVPNPFVEDIDLEDVREAIKGCAEFFEKLQDDLIGPSFFQSDPIIIYIDTINILILIVYFGS